eukprot:GHVS01009373.1.p1 GENE.GHVS01009373.1~~GHVS01009373.1.p1  ORF type:complete len:147 (+),score=50.88 GHVS01009373.1:68-508(+)
MEISESEAAAVRKDKRRGHKGKGIVAMPAEVAEGVDSQQKDITRHGDEVALKEKGVAEKKEGTAAVDVTGNDGDNDVVVVGMESSDDVDDVGRPTGTPKYGDNNSLGKNEADGDWTWAEDHQIGGGGGSTGEEGGGPPPAFPDDLL